MICPGCRKQFQQGERFCYACGNMLPEQSTSAGDQTNSATPGNTRNFAASTASGCAAFAPALAPEPEEVTPPPPALPGSAAQDFKPQPLPGPQPVRYSGFIVLVLTMILCASLALFFCVQAWAMRSLGTLYRTALPLALLAALLGKLAFSEAKQIGAHPEPRGFTNLLKACVAVALIFFAVAALTAWQLGTRRFAFDAMVTNWRHLANVGKRISVERSRAFGISAKLTMYEEISREVSDMAATTALLIQEEHQFVERYPEYQTQSDKEMFRLEIYQKRAELLQQQIAVAQTISSQNAGQQALLWRRQMQPLLDQEMQLIAPAPAKM